MPVTPRWCYVAVCDVCRTELAALDDESVLHFEDRTAAVQVARNAQWHELSDDRLVCPAGDSDHQAALDELMPPEPLMVPEGQGELWTEGGAR